MLKPLHQCVAMDNLSLQWFITETGSYAHMPSKVWVLRCHVKPGNKKKPGFLFDKEIPFLWAYTTATLYVLVAHLQCVLR